VGLPVAVVAVTLCAAVLTGAVSGKTAPLRPADARGAGPTDAPAIANGRVVAAGGPTFAWSEVTGAPSPGPRVDAGLVYDTTDGYLLLFGGEHYGTIPSSDYNDTWTFQGGHWTNVTHPADAPPQGTGFMMADDPADHEVVLFGGLSAHNQVLNDTWTYAAGTWTNVTAAVGAAPPATFWGSMSYDNATGTVVLFGGQTGFTESLDYTNATWSFHDDRWTNLAPPRTPSARISSSLAYDPAAGALLLFGGMNYTAGPLNDTWTFGSGTWTEVPTTGAPAPVWGAGLVFDPAVGAPVLYGGTPAENYDVYTLASGVWTGSDAAPNPGQTLGEVLMAFDLADGYAVLEQETLTYANVTWALSVGGAPPPALTVTASAAPLSGATPLIVHLASTVAGGTPPYTITWQFGDGSSPLSGDPASAGNASHTYAASGAFSLNLTVLDSGSHSFAQNWTIEASAPTLELSISATPNPAAPNATVAFTSHPSGGAPPYTYLWTFGDGATATTRNASHAYLAVGSYLARLVVTDQSGATTSSTVAVTIANGTSPAGAGSTPAAYYYLAGAGAGAVALLLAAVVYRRRRAPPPAASAPPPPAGPP